MRASNANTDQWQVTGGPRGAEENVTVKIGGYRGWLVEVRRKKKWGKSSGKEEPLKELHKQKKCDGMRD